VSCVTLFRGSVLLVCARIHMVSNKKRAIITTVSLEYG